MLDADPAARASSVLFLTARDLRIPFFVERESNRCHLGIMKTTVEIPVNIERGYGTIEIRSPTEVLEYE